LFAGISKKVILTFLLFFNFLEPSKSADLEKNSSSGYKNYPKIGSLKLFKNLYSYSSSNLSSKNKFKNIFFDKKLLNRLDSLFAFTSEQQNEILIQSDEQSEINDVIYAEGYVSLSY